MTGTTRLIALGLVGWLGAVCPAAAQEDSLDWRIEHIAAMDPTQVKTFLEQLQRHLAHNDRRAVCGMASYPLRVGGPRITGARESLSQGVRTDIGTSDQCNRQFRDIFSSRVVKSVLSARFENLFANYQGVMVSGDLGEGANVWLSRNCRMPCQEPAPIKVVTINR